MFDLEKTREKIIALDESDAKSIVMLIVTYLDMAKDGTGNFSSEQCVEELIKIIKRIPEPNVLKKRIKQNLN